MRFTFFFSVHCLNLSWIEFVHTTLKYFIPFKSKRRPYKYKAVWNTSRSSQYVLKILAICLKFKDRLERCFSKWISSQSLRLRAKTRVQVFRLTFRRQFGDITHFAFNFLVFYYFYKSTSKSTHWKYIYFNNKI